MDSEDIVYFYQSEEIFEKAKIVFEIQKKELEKLIPFADIQHVGSCAIPGAIGKFDIDLQIRVNKADFRKLIQILKQEYQHKHPEIWTDSFAIFSNNKEYLIDIMATIIDSEYDDFYKVRNILMVDKKLLNEYNDLKKEYNGKKYSEYREAKNKFFGGNGKVRFLK